MTAHALVSAIASAAVQGGVLVLLALIATRRLAPAWQAGVWLVVLAKLALPWTPALPWSFADLLAREHVDAPLVASNALAAPHAVSSAWLLLLAVWAAGAAFVLARAITRHPWRRPPGELVREPMLAELAALVGVRTPRLVVGDPANGPFVAGLVRPTIVVPPALLLDRALLRAALLHELAHVRRRDGLGRLVQLAALAVMWWNPLAYLASRRLELAREAACDAWALELSAVSPPAYARLLVAMARLRTSHAPMLAAPRALDARVAAVLAPRRSPRVGLAGRFALALLAFLALGGARAATAKTEPCTYTPALAEALRAAHPEADLDGDGVLSRDEACELQASLRRVPSAQVSELATFRDEPLGCKADQTTVSPSELSVCPEGPEGVSR